MPFLAPGKDHRTARPSYFVRHHCIIKSFYPEFTIPEPLPLHIFYAFAMA